MPHIALVLKKGVNFHLELIQLMVLYDMKQYDNSILKSNQERWGYPTFQGICRMENGTTFLLLMKNLNFVGCFLVYKIGATYMYVYI
jgi:hypothetical protein